MEFKDSETYQNLQKAFQGEAMAHLKYQFYKSQLANTSKDLENKLDEIVHNEKEHGKIWFKQLHDGIPSDETNIIDAIEGELYEHTKMYPDFAKKAYEEGYKEIGDLFDNVATIEGQHSTEFTNILRDIQNDALFSHSNVFGWKCLNCGHIHFGENAPKECPVCKHPQKYFISVQP